MGAFDELDRPQAGSYMQAAYPERGREALRRGRVSVAKAEYFLTVCTDGRCPGLTASAVAAAVMEEGQRMELDATWRVRCAVIMPDHLHLLVVLGERLALGQAVARLKAKTKGILQTFDPRLRWERDFFDRRVRPDDERLSLFLYIFFNPYRAGLCKRAESWPWFRCRDNDWEWFKEMLDADRPAPEWLV